MPIYEYHCLKCDNNFEEIVFSSTEEVTCPECDETKIEKLMSGFSYKSDSTFSSSEGPSCSGCSSSDCGSCH